MRVNIILHQNVASPLSDSLFYVLLNQLQMGEFFLHVSMWLTKKSVSCSFIG